jgi:acyl carrier protein
LLSQQVTDILAEILGIDNEDITLQTALAGSSGIKPVDLAKLVIECEQNFRITIHDEDVHTFKTVSDLVDYIEKAKTDR